VFLRNFESKSPHYVIIQKTKIDAFTGVRTSDVLYEGRWKFNCFDILNDVCRWLMKYGLRRQCRWHTSARQVSSLILIIAIDLDVLTFYYLFTRIIIVRSQSTAVYDNCVVYIRLKMAKLEHRNMSQTELN
jgi:hypothetical protein